jgi:TonB family protein
MQKIYSRRELLMTTRIEKADSRSLLFHGLMLIVLPLMVIGMACQQATETPSNAKATPANTTVAAKPTESEPKQAEPTPQGKEVKPADGPALKSIIPVEGTVLGGVLNDLAVELPKPDSEAAKTANETGTVTVEVIVNEKGVVSTSSVVSGPKSLWSAAAAAARKARFDPPLHNGKPVKVAGVLTYEFTK